MGDLSRVHTISYLSSDPNQGYLRRPIEPNPPKSPQFSRPTSTLTTSRLGGGGDQRSRCSSRSINANSYYNRDRSVPRGMYSVLSSMRSGGSSSRARSPSMMNEEAIQLAAYPSGQKPSPDQVPKIERDDFPAPPFPYHPERAASKQHQQQHDRPTVGDKRKQQADEIQDDEALEQPAVQRQTEQQQRASRPRSREFSRELDDDSANSLNGLEDHTQFRKEEEELSKIANGIGKIFLQTLKEREKLRAWKRANLDPRNASRTPSATRELPSRLRYENPTNASPSRDLDRARPWELEQQEQQYHLASGEQSPTRTRSSLGRQSAANQQLSASAAAVDPYTQTSSATPSAASYGYKVVQSNRSTPKPGYGLTAGPYNTQSSVLIDHQEQLNDARFGSEVSFAEQQRLASSRSSDLLGKAATIGGHASARSTTGGDSKLNTEFGTAATIPYSKHYSSSSTRSLAGGASYLRRSMPNVAQLHHIHHDGPPKLYPYHLLATTNYRLPPDVDRCHLERHLSNEEFQYIFHCDRLDFYRLPEWKRNELKRRAKLF